MLEALIVVRVVRVVRVPTDPGACEPGKLLSASALSEDSNNVAKVSKIASLSNHDFNTRSKASAGTLHATQKKTRLFDIQIKEKHPMGF